MLPLLLTLLPALLDKLIPDKGAADAAKLEFLRLAQTGEIAQLQADTQTAVSQGDVNKTEAANPSLFVAGWRPFVGWTCGAAMAFKYLGGPLLVMLAALAGHPLTLPAIDAADLTPILLSMLGLGIMWTTEKLKDKA